MLQRIGHNNGVVTYRSAKLASRAPIHAFSTRLGGVSEGPYASLNLGTLEKSSETDFNTSVAENFRRLRQALGVDKYLRAAVRQNHSAEVWVPPAGPTKPTDAPRADAIVTDQPGKLLTVRVADCVPILLASNDGRVIAAVHAGWRGIIAGIVGATLQTMRDRFEVEPAEITSAIGPAISVEHFEVDEAVAEQFITAGLGQAVNRGFGDKPHINLPDAVLMQLVDRGVRPDAIDATDRCTYRDDDEFFSHRRDKGVTGRLAAVIAI